MRRSRSQLPHCDAHDLTLLALGLAILGPKVTRGWIRAFEAAVRRQPTSLDLQLQVGSPGAVIHRAGCVGLHWAIQDGGREYCHAEG